MLVVLVAGVLVSRNVLGPREVGCWGLALLTGLALTFALRAGAAADREARRNATPWRPDNRWPPLTPDDVRSTRNDGEVR